MLGSSSIFLDVTNIWTQGFVITKHFTAWVKPLAHFAVVILKMEFWELYLPRLALNLDPSDLSLPSSYDYRHEHLVSGCIF
jgi:hypothetical protein